MADTKILLDDKKNRIDTIRKSIHTVVTVRNNYSVFHSSDIKKLSYFSHPKLKY